MKNFISTFIKPYFAFAASACSIIGLIIVVLSDKNATLIALITLCLCIILILIGVILAIDKMLYQNYGKEYKGISSFYVYQTDDGIKSTFEIFRLIQCKRMHNDDAKLWDSAILKFKKPLTYNESTVVHVKTENDDHDGTAKPFIYCRLEYPIDIMQFRVLLAYKPEGYAEKAIFERKLISQEIDSDYEYLESVEFNCLYKQYYHVVVDPSPGYIYRLRWVK